ncbi:hypothetical protein HJC99_06630 [Candidatus Saccharibacteria bacterium]|nr:hypothetical protein [Candidatus Saccharibacteria bacterium]
MPGQINLLVQVRDLIGGDDLQALADNIASMGLLQLPGVAELTLSQLRPFLKRHNAAWGQSYTAASMTAGIDKLYLVGCFGHRRILAHKLLWESGCTDCNDEFGPQTEPGECWARHPETLDPNGMEVRVTRNLSWVEAMLRQSAENTYVPPPPEREAKLWEQLWADLKAANSRLTIKQFAAKVGRPPAIVSERLRFQRLPEEVRIFVERGHIKWGIAVELLRLPPARFGPQQVIFWMQYAFSRRMTVKQFHKVINGQLGNQEDVLDSMFVFDSDATRREVLDAAIRGIPLSTLAMEHRALFDQLRAIEGGILGDNAAALHHPEVVAALGTAKAAHAAIARVSRSRPPRRRLSAASA